MIIFIIIYVVLSIAMLAFTIYTDVNDRQSRKLPFYIHIMLSILWPATVLFSFFVLWISKIDKK